MAAEGGIASPVLTQGHENSGVGESSHRDCDFLDRFGRLMRVDRPRFRDGRKNGLYGLIHLLLGKLRLGIFFVQLSQRLGLFFNTPSRCRFARRMHRVGSLLRVRGDSPVEVDELPPPRPPSELSAQ